jgi:hypothetical protein
MRLHTGLDLTYLWTQAHGWTSGPESEEDQVARWQGEEDKNDDNEEFEFEIDETMGEGSEEEMLQNPQTRSPVSSKRESGAGAGAGGRLNLDMYLGDDIEGGLNRSESIAQKAEYERYYEELGGKSLFEQELGYYKMKGDKN